ncbi:MAG: flagellar biosynthetic protein FliR [Clostridiales bacterium]|nr:flagellar biosynthetic protein FliR [Clostridiales bacterium]
MPEVESIWDIIVNNFIVFVMVLARVSGIFTFNPILGRNNVPLKVRAGASFAFAVVFTSFLEQDYVFNSGDLFGFAIDIFKEMAIGLVLGFFVNMMLTVFFYAGELMDMQVGLGMAKILDPSSGINMPIFASFHYYWFLLYFFIVGGHYSYINLFAISYEALPIGFSALNINLSYIIVSYFTEVLKLAVRFALPIIVAEMIAETAIGVMMKAVPTIQVFVVNIQLKLIIGLILMVVLASPMSDFINYIMDIMLSGLYNLMPSIGVA